MELAGQLTYDDKGLIPAIVQDDATGDVLMMAWMNAEAVQRTLETGRATFWSRSRRKLWVKGETSGHTQSLCSMRVDCDADCLLVRVDQVGATCHEGYRSCFFRTVSQDGETLAVNQDQVFDPNAVYGSA